MELLTQDLIEKSVGELMDQTRDQMMKEDKIHLQDEADLSALEERYLALTLDRHDKMIIGDYIACLQTTDARIADIAYMAGIKDAIKLLKSLDLIKLT